MTSFLCSAIVYLYSYIVTTATSPGVAVVTDWEIETLVQSTDWTTPKVWLKSLQETSLSPST
jgi:hypothetical protein